MQKKETSLLSDFHHNTALLIKATDEKDVWFDYSLCPMGSMFITKRIFNGRIHPSLNSRMRLKGKPD